MSGSLYTISKETQDQLKKFRLGSSRVKDPQAKIYMIDLKTQEIKAAGNETFSDMLELADELPESSPRFILLSYPMTLPDGRLSVPYVLLYYLPETASTNAKMSYAGAVELLRTAAATSKVVEIDSADDLNDIQGKLKGGD